ncbi:hypothetical protein ONS95_012994 [Cadophora gregata]|uniref:uncharacterized protein n=1 Tax=Cadophora gregata TaxID=51156 RepID=UPI0026DCB171|nr:uncharacterized protein ONS95_012994 [Cadophora gregata]KAK0101018.1 hypothetical protein ONS96_006249 [Cadophora gregata f. sp. sojae]KAK0115952.1 hypothetical protein ONS95_012994 [Cadophora gregata]
MFNQVKMIVSFFLLIVFGIGSVFSQTPPYDPSPFDVTGTINGMALDTTTTNPLRGGTITVDGSVITVPTNLLATLPGITVAWPELFNNGAANLPGGVTWEAHVIGNRVGGSNIAGLVYISQKFSQTVQGFITSINIGTGHFTIGASNVDCVLNDPVGRFGLSQSGNELWTSDPDNPSIHAVNGFPVCIPRSTTDPLCPAKNRPNDPATGKPITTLTFKDPATLTPTDPDPRQMLPLAVGDYVTVSGTEISGTLWVNNLVANLAIFTAAGTKPAYVTCEEAIFGVVTNQAGEIGQSRAVAFTTDVGGGLLDWFALDVDPCTGKTTERTLNVPMQPNNAIQPLGRAVYRTPVKTDLTPATRYVGFRMASGTTIGAGNITAGEFIQPIFDYIFPEPLDFGAPLFPNSFEVIPYLALGGGPYTPGKLGFPLPASQAIVGQLNPWPGAVPPPATSCAPLPTTTITPSSTLTTASSPTATVKPPVDTIVITSATGRNQRGATTLTVTATTTSKDPTILLSITAAGQNPIPLTAMTLVSPGSWSFVATVKSKPLTVTVTSSFGGGPVTANVV